VGRTALPGHRDRAHDQADQPAQQIGHSQLNAAFALLRRSGQGRGRTADLPLFRRLCRSRPVHHRPPERPRWPPSPCRSPGPSPFFQNRC
jgi:hypothetical protein